METKDIIKDVFRKNREGVRIVEENVRYSYIQYVLERIINRDDLSDNKIKRIRDELALRLGYTPDIRTAWLDPAVIVYTKNPSPFPLEYPKKVFEDWMKDYYYLPFAPGMDAYINPVILDFVESSPLLINGEDGSGKTNLIKVIIESSRKSGEVKYIVGDLSGGGYRNSKYCTVIKDKDGVLSALKELQVEIKRRRELNKRYKKEKFEITEEVKNGLKNIVFIIDDYSSLCTTKKEADELMKTVRSIKKSGRMYAVFLVLSAPRIPSLLGEEFVSLFKNIITFRMEDEKECSILVHRDDLALPLYERGDAFLLDNDDKNITRMQCFKL